ncbi:MAG: lantibiotic dehydratase [Micropruina sp.]|uniref:lantibiotic dehydratase n=1 Tax=Micropruina sp. TaxID=2737536 RepID=UPI0039E35F1B
MGPDVRAVLTDSGPDVERGGRPRVPLLNGAGGSVPERTSEPEPSIGTALYRVAPWVTVRTPLLPVERLPWVRDPLRSLDDPAVVRALAIGSPTLLQKTRRAEPDPREASRTRTSLARYLIRMTTRPTPYGGFAAVSLAGWTSATDLCLSSADRTRTRPDMGWLRGVLAATEQRPDVRARLRWRADPLIAESGDRLVAQGGGSVRATEPVRLALASAASWIDHADLVERVAAGSGGSAEQVTGLVEQLIQAGLLHSDLVPALTGPAATAGTEIGGLLARADPAAGDSVAELTEALVAADSDAGSSGDHGEPDAFARVAAAARAVADRVRQSGVPHDHDHNHGDQSDTFQTDLLRPLTGALAAEVGRECAQAVEVLLRIGPGPSTSGDLAGYGRRFLARWGAGQEVPLTEVFDPTRGLGPLPHTHGAASGLDPAVQARRSERLMSLALEALRDGRRGVRLDGDTIAALSGWPATTGGKQSSGTRELSPQTAPDAPLSLDVSAFLLATDPAAVDAGAFTLVVGPNLGAGSAGRWLGRFADLFGAAGDDYYAWLGRAEADADPGSVAAEVVYLPGTPRSTNVVIRPTVSAHEIVVSGRGSAEHQLDLADLLVGHDGTRLYLRSASLGVRLRPTARHMLNHHGAPPVCQFLDAVGLGVPAEFSAFDWGPAQSLPVLPRVQVGRTVLAPARWLLSVPGWTPSVTVDAGAVTSAIDLARSRWGLPERVYVTVADNRLLLDLAQADDREQLRREFRNSGGTLRLDEALPDVADTWLPGPGGHYLTELVISLVRRPAPGSAAAAGVSQGHGATTDGIANGRPAGDLHSHLPATGDPLAPWSRPANHIAVRDRIRLPGSDWLFAKFYAPYDQLTRLLTTDLADLIDMAENSGLARRWFFLRYSDPEPHLRIRWQGQPDLLVRHLLPQVGDFAGQLLDAGRIARLTLDSYDREIERYGGAAGIELCEDVFHADSVAVRRLLALPGPMPETLAASTTALLAGLGIDRSQRLAFYQAQAALVEDPQVGRAAGADYRDRKTRLRALLGADPPPDPLADVLDALRTSLLPVGATLREAERAGELDGTMAVLLPSLVHMHHNRMVGPGQPSEAHLVQLLLRTERGLLMSSDASLRPA